MIRYFILFITFAMCSLRSIAGVGQAMNLGIHIIPSEMPNDCVTYLNDKLASILSANKINTSFSSDRFFIVAKPTIVSKTISEGEPTIVSLKISITYRIGDAIDNRVFTAFTQTIHGAGVNELKSWMSALTKIKNDTIFASHLGEVKVDMTAYYDNQANILIKQSFSQAQNNEYDAALATLSLIPSAINNYDKVQQALVDIYKEKCSFNNTQSLLSAKNIWAASRDRNGALQACNKLSEIISPSQNVLQQMEELYTQMGKYIDMQDAREYELLKQKIANEHELALHAADNEASLLAKAIQLGYDFLCNQIKPLNIINSFFNW